MRAQALDISVVICAHTEARWEQLARAVESLQSQSVAPREILVVIDHNLALANRAYRRLPSVRVIENAQQRGISGARNSGIAAARGAIIAFLDDDAIAAPDWLEQLLAGYSSPNVLGVGGAIEPQWQGQPPALVSRRVRLGSRLHLPRNAARGCAGTQPDRLQYVVPARCFHPYRRLPR